MKNFLRNHTNTILIFLALCFLALIIGYFSWGIGYIVMEVNQANNDKIAASGAAGFDLAGAAQIDYRGLIASMPPPAVAVAPATTSIITATSTTPESTSTILRAGSSTPASSTAP